MTIIEIFNNIANSIRNKLGISSKITPNNYSSEIDKIVTNTTVNKTSGTGNTTVVCEGVIKYTGAIEILSLRRSRLAATTTMGDNYAIFAGGCNGPYVNTTDAYNLTLTKMPIVQLSSEAADLAATTVAHFSIFAGGTPKNHATDVYNNAITKVNVTNSVITEVNLAATSVGDYAIFAGGGGDDGWGGSAVYIYDSSMSHSTAEDLSVGRWALSSTTVGSYALFGGGYSAGFPRSPVDTYNISLTHSIVEDLSKERYQLESTTIGDYALFAGGSSNSGDSSLVDSYNSSLSHSITTELNEARYGLAATTVGDFAIFGGGYSNDGNGNYYYYSTVDSYNSSLVHETLPELSEARYQLAAARVGSYVIFAGGYRSGYPEAANVIWYSTVDVYNCI